MHSFVAAILLRFPRFYKVDKDAQPDPPNAQLCQTGQACRSKWRTVVDAYGSRQSINSKDTVHGFFCIFKALPWITTAGQHIPAVDVAYRQWVTDAPVTQTKPALIVNAPYVICLPGTQKFMPSQAPGRLTPPCPGSGNQSVPF